tara:strand:- start:88 stop:846 length:759 start_codon:yes stop_codon:yes gene_type:complete
MFAYFHRFDAVFVTISHPGVTGNSRGEKWPCVVFHSTFSVVGARLGFRLDLRKTFKGGGKMKKILPVLLLFGAACTTSFVAEKPMISLEQANAPDWVLKGNGAFLDGKGKIFYGVGSATKTGDWSFQRTSADNRARNDLAKAVDFYTSSLYKDYRASDGNVTEEAINIITNANLNGVLIVDHWEHPDRREIFSLAKLDLVTVQENLNTYLKLSDRIQGEIRERAERLHKELEKKRYGNIQWSDLLIKLPEDF